MQDSKSVTWRSRSIYIRGDLVCSKLLNSTSNYQKKVPSREGYVTPTLSQDIQKALNITEDANSGTKALRQVILKVSDSQRFYRGPYDHKQYFGSKTRTSQTSEHSTRRCMIKRDTAVQKIKSRVTVHEVPMSKAHLANM